MGYNHQCRRAATIRARPASEIYSILAIKYREQKSQDLPSGRISGMLTLYFAPGSSSMAVHIALHEVDASFDAKPMSFRARDMQAADYLRLNPEGKVPTLVIDGRPLTEVAAILFYLARRFPRAALVPGDIEAEAQALSWMSFIA